MEREQTIRELSVKFLHDRYQSRLGEIQSCYEKKEEETRKALIPAVAEGAERCRENGKKVKYIILTLLESSILTKTYEIMIAFYDETIYLDKAPVYVYWCPSFVFRGIENDLDDLRVYLRGKVIRLKESELMGVRRNYVINYLGLAAELFRSSIPQMLARMREQGLELDEKFEIAMGRFMEKPVRLYGKGGEER